MTAMSKVESLFCRSVPWRGFASHVVVPWALGDTLPSGRVLEIGGGSGAMAAQLLARFPELSMTVADIDPTMLASARQRLARFGKRVDVQRADVNSLAFPDATLDQAYCWLMLHHAIKWEDALGELVRVVRPGGVVVGYDLLDTTVARTIHRLDRSAHRLFSAAALKERLSRLPGVTASCDIAVDGLVARFEIVRDT
jgi:ubiquinone/menaquinone biosynthesis C-methylase UbiE